MAIIQGASYIEKHVVFSQEMFGPDVSSAVTFEQLKFLRTSLDEMKVLSIPINKDDVTENLRKVREIFGRSLALKKSFPKGHTLVLEDFCLRKPSGGLKWNNRLSYEGRMLSKPYEVGEILDLSYFS
jgi:sialic acid synthase SpsE